MEGWIKLHRKILDSWVWKDPTAFKVFTFCLLSANHKTGQFTTGRFIGSEICGLKGITFYKALQRLKKNKMITLVTQKTNIKFTLVSVCNWSKYQTSGNQLGNNQVTIQEQSSNNPVTHYKNIRIKNKELRIPINLFLEEFNNLFERNYKPTAGRIKKLDLRLKSFTLEDILKALQNLSQSPFHRGVNDRGWSADPDFLLRNDEQIDKWLNVNMEEAKQLSKFSKEAKNANRFIGHI